ncbi:MAG: thioredoxin-disulfide reductase [Muribaculaceae bacterium]|nr:thioredoxin-disulfide reductase [Muribaculaceae bacterium]MDE6553719.1 thioredoxin-disulfide reductase [Muribaculaceae bacterium]
MSTAKVLVIGSGPAGYTAGIYAGRANLTPIIYEGNQPGGQLTTTSEVENFPGYPDGIGGMDMMDQLRKQAERFGAEVRPRNIESIDLSKRPFVAIDDHGDEIVANTVIICTGASAKYLGIPDETKYQGMGVSACAVCDGFFYRKKDVAVIGGGDTACEEALYLSSLCNKVYLIVRKPYLRASDVMRKRVANTPNIEILFECNVTGLFGDQVVEGAHVVRALGTEQEDHFDIKIDGFFLGIGHTPNTKFLNGQVELDEQGYIKVKGDTTETNVEGVFAAGDVADPRYRQAIVAAGSGAKAALDAEHFLTDHAEL